jgi:hypothetical protein
LESIAHALSDLERGTYRALGVIGVAFGGAEHG